MQREALKRKVTPKDTLKLGTFQWSVFCSTLQQLGVNFKQHAEMEKRAESLSDLRCCDSQSGSHKYLGEPSLRGAILQSVITSLPQSSLFLSVSNLIVIFSDSWFLFHNIFHFLSSILCFFCVCVCVFSWVSEPWILCYGFFHRLYILNSRLW